MDNADVVIVGAGAAGLATAIFLGRARAGARVAVLDGSPKIGLKILVSGGGRCNVTNVNVGPADYYSGQPNVLRRVLSSFPARAALAFFEQIGVDLYEEDYGKLFPITDSAATVLDALLAECDRVGVSVLPDHRVVGVRGWDHGFQVEVDRAGKHEVMQAARVVLATGGMSMPRTGSDGFGYEIARSLGHTIVPTTPALDPLLLEDARYRDLSGATHDVQIHVGAGKRRVTIEGPWLWTHFGASGPSAMNLSRFWHRARIEDRDEPICVNFTGGLEFALVERRLIEQTSNRPKTQISSALREWVPARVAKMLVSEAGITGDQPIGQLPRDSRRRLVHVLVSWSPPISGTRGYKFAEATAGGVPLAEIQPATMESCICPGLYLVGEILDVDGRIGGFNFQWAWSSGYVAGNAIGQGLEARGRRGPGEKSADESAAC